MKELTVTLSLILGTTLALTNSIQVNANDASPLWGYVDRSGKLSIAAQYQDAYAFSEGLAAVQKDGNWGFIDKTGAMVLDSQYDKVCRFS